ncbi:hypothetical protein [uncultured Acinetobacter sp.]|uniref:hypothetical protein n=1 Tax=uncultured Acinetobacter sp. TaxID=165433 RepID=UPI002590D9E3|nr:hypothetical protein [uncultured Acinetobacter sp.]
MNKQFEDKIIEEITSIKNEVKEIRGKDRISNLIDVDKFNSYFIGLSVISLFIIFSYYINIDDKENWARNYLFWGSIGGKIILSILVLNYIYRFNFIKYFFELKFTKLISGLIFSAAVLYSNSKASSLINEIFSVSATNFPYSLTFTTAFYSINYIANILSIIALILTIIFIFLEINHYIDKKEFNFDKEKGIIIIFFLFFIISLGLQYREFSENAIRFKAYQLALAMDFNKKYSCDGIPSNFSVAYIGNSQQKVIINMSNSEENVPLNFENFLMNSDKGFVSKLFIVQPCFNNQISLQQGSTIIKN